MTKPHDPYSRVYWRIVDDERFANIYGNDANLAAWLRLLIAADQAWPASANLPVSARRAPVKALEACGLVELKSGGLFRIHGLDAERSKRTDHATAAASRRWTAEHTGGHPVSIPRASGEHPVSIPKVMLDKTRRDETSLDETTRGPNGQSSDDDLWALYAGLTRTPARKPATLGWLERIETTYGLGPSAKALREEHAKDSNPGTLLSRTSARLEDVARRVEKDTAADKRSEGIQARVRARAVEKYRFTGQWDEALYGPPPAVELVP